MRKYLGWVTLAVPLLGGFLASYSSYITTQGGGVQNASAETFSRAVIVLSAVGGCVAFVFTTFRSNVAKWLVCFPLYLAYMFVAMVAIEIAINGLHLRLF